MAKQLNVSMNFTANTSQAKSQIQDLSNMLNKIAYSTDIKVNASGISEASTAAKELSYHLKNAYNVKTGNFDLSALNKSLKSAKTDITQLSNKLLTAGKTGQEAFVKLSQTIAQADQPVITMGTHLNNLFNTLKNTLRWQISNSMITGVTGAIQQAFYYAQDLDKSLNNIRIVTSKSSDEMAKFAKEANAAARSLSTTTTKYTDASLIYYQQGLDDETVKARTDATVKMANVTGDAAETVSSQMTAIWNNFDDGSKKLEYYADVITALGAATASSSAEIAQGLEKFASVADTVGLSYEYATSALATVVATTRQSADIVGTSFKTLFARIEGLKLNGVDEEDGTTLNKYSQALADVGVNIKDANGELKDMDEILNDLGEKWQGLDKDTRIALAQTVGGARQYTQLIALMDNWGEFQKNLGVAQGSEGTLEEQAEIYAESWQAAKDRVRASAEGIYDSLINEDFFIDLDNWLSKMLDGIGDFIDGIGGIKGVLLTVGAIATSLLSKQVGPAVEKLKQDFSVLTGGAQTAYKRINEDTKNMVSSQLATGNYTEEQKLELEGNARILQMKSKLAQAADTLSEKERSQAEFAIQSMEMQNKEAFEYLENKKKAEKAVEDQTKKIQEQSKAVQELKDKQQEADDQLSLQRVQSQNNLNLLRAQHQTLIGYDGGVTGELINAASDEDVGNMIKLFSELAFQEKEASGALELYTNELTQLQEISQQNFGKAGEKYFEEVRQSLIEFSDQLPISQLEIQELQSSLRTAGNEEGLKLQLNKIIKILDDTGKQAETTEEQITLLQQALGKKGVNVEKAVKDYQKLKDNLEKANKALEEAQKAENADEAELKRLRDEVTKAEKALNDYSKSLDKTAESSENLKHHAGVLESITGFIGGLGSAAMGLNALKSAVEGLSNPDASGWEKFSSAIMGVSFGAPMVVSGIKNIVTNFGGLKDSANAAITAIQNSNKANKLLSLGYKDSALQIMAQRAATDEATAARMKSIFVKKSGMATEQADIVIKKLTTGATLEEAMAAAALDAALLPLIGTIGIIVAALALLAGGIYLSYQKTHEARIEAKKAAEDLKTVSEAFNEVKSSVDEVNSSLDGLADKYKSIEDMTYGTTEWGKSVRELNKELEEMIDKYDLVKGEDWFRDSEGVIRLTEQGQETLRNNVNAQLKSAERAKDAAELRVKTAQIAANRETLFANYTGKYDIKAFGGSGNELSPQIVDTIINALKQNPQQELNAEFLKDFGFDDNIVDLIDKDEKLKVSIEELTEATREAADAYKNEVIDQLLGSKELENIDENYRTGVLEQIGEGSKEQIEARAATIDANKYRDKYAETLNYTKSGRKYYKTDENGNALLDQEVEISDKSIQSWQALNEIIEENEESIKNYVKTVEESKKVWEAADGIKDAWEKAKEGTNDAKSALKDVIKSSKKEFSTLMGISEKAWKEMGINAEDFAVEHSEKVEDALNGDAEAVESLREELAKKQLEVAIGTRMDQTSKQTLMDEVVDLQQKIDNVEVGFDLTADNTDVLNSLAQIMTAAEFTSKDMAQAFVDAMGVDVDLVEQPGPTNSSEVTITGPLGIPFTYKRKETSSIWVPKATSKVVKASGGDVVRRASGGGKTSAPSAPSPSSSGSKETKDKDNSEVERYYVINQVLKELTSQMNKLGKEKDRAFGANKLKAINNEIALLQQQKKAQQEYLREAKMYRDTDQNGLKNLFGGKFNAQGIFTNYDDIFAKEQKAYNDAIAKYNESAQKDYDKNRLAEAEARWNKFSELAKQYESDLQNVQKAEEDVQDTINEIADKSFEIIQYTVQLKLDMAEDTKKYLDFLLSGAERKEFNVAEQIAITGKTAQVYSDQRSAAAQGLADILGLHNLTADQAASLSADQLSAMNFTEDEVDTIRKYRDTIIEADGALADLADTINEYVTKALDEWMDKLDKTASNYDHLNKLLNDYKNILGLIDQKATGIDRKLIEDLNQAMLDNARNKYESSIEAYNALKQLEKQYQVELDNATTSGDAQRIAYWTKNMEDLQEKIKDANETMLENWQETLEIAQKNFQETVKAALDSMYDGIGGLANFDLLKEQFEREKDLADDYIDDFNKAYELNKLNRKIQNSLDDTKGIKNKELLRDLQKEINDLQASGAQISKYDLEYLQKKYEMRKAEIALEEAQNAKTTVRMRQDNEGNWGYVYTADQDNIDNAKQTYEDKLADLYNLTKQYSESTQSEYMKILDEYNKAVDDAATRYANDSEVFAQAMDQIQEFYSKKLIYYSSELGKTFENNHDLYVHDTQYYQEMTDSNIFNSAMFAQKFDETILGTLRGMPNTLEELNTNVESSWDRASETVTAAYTTLYDYLYGEQGIAPSIAAVTQEATKEITQTSNTARQTITRDTQKMTSDMTEVVNKVVEWQKKWTTNIAAMNTSDAKLIKELGEILAKLTNIGNSKPTPQVEVKYKGVDQLDSLLTKLSKLHDQTVTITTKYVTSGDSSGGVNSSVGNGGPTMHSLSTPVKWTNGISYGSKTTINGEDYVKVSPGSGVTGVSGDTWIKWFENLRIARSGSATGYKYYDTGGYTGEWDSSGKLAVLHQKEIVLNKDDTANFLAGISVLRDIVKQIDLRSLVERQALSNLQVNVPRDSSSTLQQNITINAEFPGVQTHSEIEMAFDNLLGKATQFANRKK